MRLLLGSKSPRRKELLKMIGFSFEEVSMDVEEVYPPTLQNEQIPEYLCKLKAMAYKGDLKNEILLTADTIVWHNGEPLGKPKNQQDAFKMLQSMCGSKHQVISSFCIRTEDGCKVFSDTATVYFGAMTADEIWNYIKTDNPMDKAGAYGIQEYWGAIAIPKIEGSYFTIMGLPTHLVYEQLKTRVNISKS